MEMIENICPISERRYEELPVDKIKVINSRNRDKDQFEMNVESIDSVGLLKPIRVNDKFLKSTGKYELICGEGRLLAHKQLGRTHVPAEVVTCTRKEALLQSLIENIARTKPGSMDFARELKRLHDEGWDYPRIAQVACKTERYIRDYIQLVEQGEERLIQGVESGIFPITFAIQVASTDDSQIQAVLMDAFADGLVTTSNFGQARRIISARAKQSKRAPARNDYTVGQLQQDIAETTRAKTGYVREAKSRENRFMTLLAGVNTLFQDAELVALLREQQLDKRPDLVGDFKFESTTNAEVSS